MSRPLLAAPNVSAGSDGARVARLERAFARGVELLDTHTDADHDRTVFTLAGSGVALGKALVAGAVATVESVDMAAYRGVHPAIGALDVCPVVWPSADRRAAARETAIAVAGEIGEMGVPVFFYGELASGPDHVERAYFRNGGLVELRLRMEAGELHPDRGPSLPHPSAGATLVTARPPLGAFNVELDSPDVEVAQSVAAGLREAGGGLPGVRAIGLSLAGDRTQVSTNVHDPIAVPLGEVVERVRALAAPLGARPVEGELIGLIPTAALDGYPEDVPLRGFDPARHTIEGRLGDR